jgi:nucleoside-diphosphate-sugar epimerase
MSKAKIDLNSKAILVTGSPGFIGANLVRRLLKDMSCGTVISLDNMNDYYDPKIKEYSLASLKRQHWNLRSSIFSYKARLQIKNWSIKSLRTTALQLW